MQTQLSGTYEGMMANFQSLMARFDQKILEYGQRGRNQSTTPSVELTEELNKVKLERAKIKQIWINMQTMTEGQVLDLKEEYDKDYKNNYTNFSKFNYLCFDAFVYIYFYNL